MEAETINLFHVTRAENLDAINAHGLVPAIGERSAALGETEAAIYCYRSLADVTDGLGTWLGECFEEDEELIIIELTVPLAWTQSEAFETRIVNTVTPGAFVRVLTEDEIG